MKKIVSIALLLCILLITACTPAPQLLSFMGDESGAATLDGITLYFRASLDPSEESYLGYATNTTFADMALERVAQVEKDLDVNIERSSECKENLNDIIYLLASGGGKMDVNIGMDYDSLPMSQMYKAFVPMSSVSEYIDIYDSEKWGSPARLKMFAWNNEIYGVIPAYWPEIEFASSDFVLVANSDYIASLNLTDPREFHENGVWTMEKFEEVIAQYTSTDNNGEKIYGYGYHNRHIYEMLLQYYGADWAEKDSDGNWKFGALTEAGKNAAQKLRDIQAGYLKDYCYEGGVGDQTTVWLTGNMAIATQHTAHITQPTAQIPQSRYKYAILPFPSSDGKSVFGQFERNVEAIHITSFSDFPTESAMVLSAIYEPFEGYETESVLKELYNTNHFFDERDTDVLFDLANNVRVVLQVTDFQEMNKSLANDLKTNELSTVLAKYEKKMQELLETEFIPVEETMEYLFPNLYK